MMIHMNRHYGRWALVPVFALLLTGCTSLTEADGSVTAPTTEPSSTEMTGWEREQLGIFSDFGIPEPTPEIFTKETLPSPESMIPFETANKVSKGSMNTAETSSMIKLPKPVSEGSVIVDFICVDGTISLEDAQQGYPNFDCNGQPNSVAFDISDRTNPPSIKLTVTAGTSYTIGAYQDSNFIISID